MIKRAFYLGLIVTLTVLLPGCKSMDYVAINALQPAAVELTPQVKRVGVVHQVQLSLQPLGEGQLESAIQSRDALIAKQGVKAAIDGLYQALCEDERFEEVILIESKAADFEVIGIDSATATEAHMDALCKSYQIDALFSLKHFDTQTEMATRKTKMEELDMLRVPVLVPAKEITLETLVENGWGIYDAVTKQLIDEFSYQRLVVASAKGQDPFRALQALSFRKDSILSESYSAGGDYGRRLKPFKEEVQRLYYTTGSDNLKLASKMVTDNNWNMAQETWMTDTRHEKAKIRSRACHNLAVFFELQEDLHEAHSWASLAVTHFPNEISERYVSELEGRIENQPLIEAQLTPKRTPEEKVEISESLPVRLHSSLLLN